MMDVVFVLLVFVTITFIASYRNAQIEQQIAKRSQMVKCPPHKWEYLQQPGSDDRYMQCTRCGMLPGGRSGGDL